MMKVWIPPHRRKRPDDKGYITVKGHFRDYGSKEDVNNNSTGWQKDMDKDERRARVLESMDKRYSKEKQLYVAYKRLKTLGNLTQDPETRRKALRDSGYFYHRYRKETKGGN